MLIAFAYRVLLEIGLFVSLCKVLLFSDVSLVNHRLEIGWQVQSSASMTWIRELRPWSSSFS